jgi:hypothetical protein
MRAIDRVERWLRANPAWTGCAQLDERMAAIQVIRLRPVRKAWSGAVDRITLCENLSPDILGTDEGADIVMAYVLADTALADRIETAYVRCPVCHDEPGVRTRADTNEYGTWGSISCERCHGLGGIDPEEAA